jgi:ligand-binding SRPBCC domain-containing protein
MCNVSGYLAAQELPVLTKKLLHMKLYSLKDTVTLNTNIEKAWDFFSTPHNLPLITPKSLNFQILSDPPKQIYAGLIIHYHVSPLLGVPLQWVTEITHVVDKKMFIDEQRFGPYLFWHHQHHFEATAEGVLMTDIVHYALRLDPLSRPVHALIVRPQVNEIFRYRASVLEKYFPN